MSYDQKISRAQMLSKNESPVREVLGIFIKVANFQKNISQRLNGNEHHDIRSLLRFLPELKTLVNNLGSAPLQTATAALSDDWERWSHLLLQYWEQDSEISSPADAFLAFLLLQPYAQHVTGRMKVSSD